MFPLTIQQISTTKTKVKTETAHNLMDFRKIITLHKQTEITKNSHAIKHHAQSRESTARKSVRNQSIKLPRLPHLRISSKKKIDTAHYFARTSTSTCAKSSIRNLRPVICLSLLTRAHAKQYEAREWADSRPPPGRSTLRPVWAPAQSGAPGQELPPPSEL